MRPASLTLAALFTLVAFPSEARTWSRDGHRIVCRIAWLLLDDTRRADIDRLTSAYHDGDGQPLASYWDACSLPDEERGRAANNLAFRRFAVLETWHFANVSRSCLIRPVRARA